MDDRLGIRVGHWCFRHIERFELMPYYTLMNQSSRRPTESTIVPALLDAVDRLCADTSPENVGMRDIANNAGLSLGVAYRYFDSKDDLYGAALDRLAERLSDAVTDSDDTSQAISGLWDALADNPAFPRIVTWAILDGQNVSDIMTKHPVARDVIKTATDSGATNPPMVAAMTVLVSIAGAIYGETINRAMQRDPDDRELYNTAADMLAIWITNGQQETR